MRLNFITIFKNYLAASSCFAQYSYKRYSASIVQDFIVLSLKVQKIIKIRSAAHIFILPPNFFQSYLLGWSHSLIFLLVSVESSC